MSGATLVRLRPPARLLGVLSLAAVVLGSVAGCAATPTPTHRQPPAPTSQTLEAGLQSSIGAGSFPSATGGWIGVTESKPTGAAIEGVILSTTDGGAEWTPAWRGQSFPYYSDFSDPEHGWVLARPAGRCATPSASDCPLDQLLATSDGGARWTVLPSPPLQVSGLSFASPQLGVAASSPSCADGASLTAATCPGQVLLTTNGGSSWSVALKTTGPVVAAGAHGADLFAVTGHTGLASKAPGATQPSLEVLRSSDRGAVWSEIARFPQLFDIGPSLTGRLLFGPKQEMWFAYLDQGSCAMHGCGMLGGFVSLDGGLTWRPDGAPDAYQGAECGDFAPPGAVAITPSGTVVATYQRGLATCSPPASTLSAAAAGGASWQRLHEWSGFAPNELAFPTDEVGYAASQGAVLATSDSGHVWNQIWPAISPTDGIDPISSTAAFGYGDQGSNSVVLQTTNGGGRWVVLSHLPSQVLALHFDGPELGYAAVLNQGSDAASDYFSLYRSSDGGRGWSLVGPGFASGGWQLAGIWLTASGSGVASLNGARQGPAARGWYSVFYTRSAAQGRWSSEGTPDPPPGPPSYPIISSISFIPATGGGWLGAAVVQVARSSRLEVTKDLGASWTVEPSSPHGLTSIQLLGGSGSSVACSVANELGGNPTSLRCYWAATPGGSWRPTAGAPTAIEDSYLGTEQLGFISRDQAWLMAAGLVWRTEDGGLRWQSASPGPPA